MRTLRTWGQFGNSNFLGNITPLISSKHNISDHEQRKLFLLKEVDINNALENFSRASLMQTHKLQFIQKAIKTAIQQNSAGKNYFSFTLANHISKNSRNLEKGGVHAKPKNEYFAKRS